jgi:hypothetical protein
MGTLAPHYNLILYGQDYESHVTFIYLLFLFVTSFLLVISFPVNHIIN